MNRIRILGARAALLASLITASAASAGTPSPSCDESIAPIRSGYGADGRYSVDQQSVTNPSFSRKDVQVFLPTDIDGPQPVIFFSHGYGPNFSEAYSDLIHHLVSRGYVVVYSTYPALFSGHDERYDDLWNGFVAAAEHFSSRIDTSRVGFVGHSYGGGASPAMAYRGFQKGWGKKGAFIAALAPWYTFQLTREQEKQLPPSVPQLFEVYEDDSINDHRMAIDQYKLAPEANRYYFLVHSSHTDGCDLVAGHFVPVRSSLLRLKQYGLYRPLDAIADVAFEQNKSARGALAAMGNSKAADGYEPLESMTQPQPRHDESFYKFPWSNSRSNPRL